MTLQIQISDQGGKKILKLSGQIDEDCDLAKHQVSGASQIVVDFKDVSLINSCGIREWIRWMSSFGKASITYTQCPKIIVDQINMVEGFLPKGGTVESFYVPYYCEECDQVTNTLATKGKEFTGSKVSVSDSSPCPQCKAAAEIDVIEGKYFKFLEKAA